MNCVELSQPWSIEFEDAAPTTPREPKVWRWLLHNALWFAAHGVHALSPFASPKQAYWELSEGVHEQS